MIGQQEDWIGPGEDKATAHHRRRVDAMGDAAIFSEHPPCNSIAQMGAKKLRWGRKRRRLNNACAAPASIPECFTRENGLPLSLLKKCQRLLKAEAGKEQEAGLINDVVCFEDRLAGSIHYSHSRTEWFAVQDTLESLNDPFTMLQSAGQRLWDGAEPAVQERQTLDDGANQEAPGEEPTMVAQYKYWLQRRVMFCRYDEGIHMDAAGWYSVTPELVALQQAHQTDALLRHAGRRGGLKSSCVLEAFVGVGGNLIQYAAVAAFVIGVEIDEGRLAMARHNAEQVYGVSNVDLLVADFATDFLRPRTADVVFISPPWGGPQYTAKHAFDPQCDISLKPAYDGYALWLDAVKRSTRGRVVAFLPRNTNVYRIAQMVKEGMTGQQRFLVESNLIDERFKGITVYAGFDANVLKSGCE